MATKRKTFSKSFPASEGRHDYGSENYEKTFDLLHATAWEWAEQNGFSIPKLRWCKREILGLSNYCLYVYAPENFEGDLSEVVLR